MDSKYIVIDDSKVISIIIFHSYINHKDMANAMKKIMNIEILSAGFITCKTDYSDEMRCYGESVSLNLKSNPEIDNRLLNMMFNDII